MADSIRPSRVFPGSVGRSVGERVPVPEQARRGVELPVDLQNQEVSRLVAASKAADELVVLLLGKGEVPDANPELVPPGAVDEESFRPTGETNPPGALVRHARVGSTEEGGFDVDGAHGAGVSGGIIRPRPAA